MTSSDTEVAIVGGGAAGIAAGRRLTQAKIDCLVVEARSRLGGRAWTVRTGNPGFPIDLGCGWLHSADRNPWQAVAEGQGRTIDRTPPPWMRPSMTIGFPPAEQNDFLMALRAFYEQVEALPDRTPDVAAASLLDPHGRGNSLINAISSYLSGTELDRVSVKDFARYDDSGINWRIVEGYGTTIAAHASGIRVALGAPVREIDHSGRRLRIVTANGTITANAAIVAVPSSILASGALGFTPPLPEKSEAAAGLPLGLADKLFLSLAGAEEFDRDSRLFGHTDRTATGAYHFRPFGRPQIEAYFGGTLASQLELEGERAFVDFAVAELVGLLGSDFAERVSLLHVHRWGVDPFARGSYSCALPGKADCRRVLAAPIDDRLFFAGEACSAHDFSTAHGAYLTGIAAADRVIAARKPSAHRDLPNPSRV